MEKVAEEIRAIINSSYKNPTTGALFVPRKDTVPTIKEVMEYAQMLLRGKYDA